MAVPRRVSRSDRVPDGRTHPSYAREIANHNDVRDFFRARQRNRCPIDPGRLIEATFLDPGPADDVDAVILAWLALLPPEAEAPAAAADLVRHLAVLQGAPFTDQQHRLLDLLAHVAAHQRVQSPVQSSELQQKAKS